jgi:hypothetical protein
MRVPLVVLALAALMACKSPREKYAAAVTAHLAALPGLFAEASSAPPVDGAASQALASVKGLSAKYLESNALLIHLEELQNPTLRRQLTVRLNHRSPTVDAATALGLIKAEAGAALDTEYSAGVENDDNMTEVWKRLGTLRYVLVVRSRAHRDAEMVGEKTFKGGTWNGEVLVFDLASRQLLGGFPLEGSSHLTVKTTEGRAPENLAADLKLATRGNFNARLREVFSSVGPNDELN